LEPSPYCYDGNGCPGLVDGGTGYNNSTGTGFTVNDEWGPTISYILNVNAGTKELVATWYDTRGDPNNKLVSIWGGSIVGPLIVGPMSTFQVSKPSTGQTVPWNHSAAPWWDYQALAPEAVTYTFLAAWGGDARLGSLQSGVWSTVIR
jgi:hypothetical protein